MIARIYRHRAFTMPDYLSIYDRVALAAMPAKWRSAFWEAFEGPHRKGIHAVVNKVLEEAAEAAENAADPARAAAAIRALKLPE